MNRKKAGILAANILFFMTIWSADPIPERGALFAGWAAAAETPLSRSVEESLHSHIRGLTGAALKTSDVHAPVPMPVSVNAPMQETQPLAKIAGIVLSHAEMGDLNPVLCMELGIGDGTERCPFRQVIIKTGDVKEVFDAIQDPNTGRINIVLSHQILGEDGRISEAYFYWTAPNAELKKTLYGKRHGARQLLSNDQAAQGFIKAVYYWVSQEQDLLEKFSQ